MRTIAAYEAETHFSALLDGVERGEEVVITRHGRPVARIVAEPSDRSGRTLADVVGSLRAQARSTGISASADEIRAWIEEDRP